MPTISTHGSLTLNSLGASNQRRVDVTSNGVQWTFLTIGSYISPFRSIDGGLTWVEVSAINPGVANGSFFIDQDDYCHVAFKHITDGFIYYLRGTPDANRTTWTWGTPLQVSGFTTNNDYPDLVAHRQGTGWVVHVVASYVQGSAPYNYVMYQPITLASDGTPTLGTKLNLGGGYSVAGSAGHTYPSIDFHHTGDAKTVQGGTPHLYVAWSAGATGAANGIRFKKGTYSGGSWSWGTERSIDPDHYVAGLNTWVNCLFDGTAVMIGGFCGGTTTNAFIWERDAADSTTTQRLMNTMTLQYGSMTYDEDRNVILLAQHGTNAHRYYRWERSSGNGALTVLRVPGNTSMYSRLKRGGSGGKIEFAFIDGASPYTAEYGVRTTRATATGQRVNVALGKSVTGSSTLSGDPALLTDGSTATSPYLTVGAGGPQWVQVDLGEAHWIDSIRVWHYWSDARSYSGHLTEVSVDGVTWTTVDSPQPYRESPEGHLVTFTPRWVRYVRNHLNGSTSNAGNHWVELDVYAVNVPALPVTSGLIGHLDPGEIHAVTAQDIVAAPAVGGATTWTTPDEGPIYRDRGPTGQPYLEHTAVKADQLQWLSDLSVGDSTIFVVARQRGTANARIFSGVTNNWLLGWHSNTEDDHYAVGWVLNSTKAATTDLIAYAARRSGANSTFFRGKTILASNTLGTGGPNGLTTNGHNGATELSDSDVYEVLVYNRALSDAEVAQVVDGYLGIKYLSQSPPRLLIRDASDAAPVVETETGQQVNPLPPTFTRSLVYPVFARRDPIFIEESTADSAPATDSATRQANRGRSTTDTAPYTSDTAVRSASRSRTATDTRTTTDAATRAPALKVRTSADAAPAVDDGTRLPATRARSSSDTIPTVTDAAVRAPVFKRSGIETRTTTDATTRRFIGSRTRSDSAPATDAPTSSALIKRTASDSAPAADSDMDIFLTRDVADAAPVSGDEVTHEVIPALVERTAADTVPPPTDAVTSSALHSRTTGETLATSDAATRAASRTRTTSDSAPVTEQAVRAGQFSRTPADTAPATDAVASPTLHARTAADAASATEAVVRQGTFARTRADSAPAVDDGTRIPLVLARATNDTVPVVTDAAVRSVGQFSRTSADAAPGSDAAARWIDLPRQVSETLATTDAVSSSATHYRAASDTAPAADIGTRSLSTAREAADTLPAPGDAAISPTRAFRTASDTAPVTEVATRSLVQPRTAIDAAPATDGTQGRGLRGRTAADAAGASDQPSRSVLYARAGTEATPGPTDAAERDLLAIRAAQDNAPAVDAVGSSTGEQQDLTDSAPATDAATRSVVVSRTGADAAPVEESLQATPILVRTSTDSAPATDASTRGATYARTHGESAPAVDDGTRLPLVFARDAEETLVVSEQATRVGQFARTSTDAATATDSATAGSTQQRSASDSASATDSAVASKIIRASASDLVPVLDTADRTTVQPRTSNDSTLSTDEGSRGLILARVPGDDAPATDAPTVRGFFIRPLTEWLTLADSVASSALMSRVAQEWLPEPDDFVTGEILIWRTAQDVLSTGDAAYATIGTDHRLAPQATLTSMSRVKVSLLTEANSSVVTFTFDQPVQAWTVRVNSTSHLDGTLVESWQGSPTNFGLVTVPAEVLRHGENRVTIYGQSVRGVWSR